MEVVEIEVMKIIALACTLFSRCKNPLEGGETHEEQNTKYRQTIRNIFQYVSLHYTFIMTDFFDLTSTGVAKTLIMAVLHLDAPLSWCQ